MLNSILDDSIFEKCNLEGTDLTGVSIEKTRFDECIIRNTKLELSGFIQIGMSKGFVLIR